MAVQTAMLNQDRCTKVGATCTSIMIERLVDPAPNRTPEDYFGRCIELKYPAKPHTLFLTTLPSVAELLHVSRQLDR
jgi:hypothetical protein